MIVIVLAVFAILIMFEAPGLIKKKQWRELAAYSTLMLIAIVILVLNLKHINIPNPARDAQLYVKSMFEYLFHLSYD